MSGGLSLAAFEGATHRFMSFGGGVQSTAMLLLALRREIGPMPDAFIFADTGWEQRSTLNHVDWCEAQIRRVTNAPLIRVSGGNIRDDQLSKARADGKRFVSIPYFLSGDGIGRRQCTKEYKLRPIIQAQRDFIGLTRGEQARRRSVMAEVWIGISADEATRAKASWLSWQVNRFPLIEAGLSRNECRALLDRAGWPQPVKSACIGCPFRDDHAWAAMEPDEFEDACQIDDQIRDAPGMRRQQFTHRSRLPLREVTFADKVHDDLFDAECEGLCGV